MAPSGHCFTTLSVFVGVGRLPVDWCLAIGDAVLLNLSLGSSLFLVTATGRPIWVTTFWTLRLGIDRLVVASDPDALFVVYHTVALASGWPRIYRLDARVQEPRAAPSNHLQPL